MKALLLAATLLLPANHPWYMINSQNSCVTMQEYFNDSNYVGPAELFDELKRDGSFPVRSYYSDDNDMLMAEAIQFQENGQLMKVIIWATPAACWGFVNYEESHPNGGN